MFLREGGWEKKVMDTQARLKANQTVSYVSAAPALVDRINSLLRRRLRASVALVISLGSCLLASSLEVAHHVSSCVR